MSNPISGVLVVNSTLSFAPVHLIVCVGTNNAVDFLDLIVDFLNQGVLIRGDILVLDNARIHKSAEIVGMLSIILDAAGVRMYFLPTYSPEVRARCALPVSFA